MKKETVDKIFKNVRLCVEIELSMMFSPISEGWQCFGRKWFLVGACSCLWCPLVWCMCWFGFCVRIWSHILVLQLCAVARFDFRSLLCLQVWCAGLMVFVVFLFGFMMHVFLRVCCSRSSCHITVTCYTTL